MIRHRLFSALILLALFASACGRTGTPTPTPTPTAEASKPQPIASTGVVISQVLAGVKGEPESMEEESFEGGPLDYPQYARPADWQGRTVPEVLVSGNHEKIRAWRLAQAEEMTRRRRPDLWAKYVEAARNRGVVR